MKDQLLKIIYLIEKEIDLHDTRPKKERKYHPKGDCQMNKIISAIEKYKNENR